MRKNKIFRTKLSIEKCDESTINKRIAENIKCDRSKQRIRK